MRIKSKAWYTERKNPGFGTRDLLEFMTPVVSKSHVGAAAGGRAGEESWGAAAGDGTA